jgi:hypothetical protein
MEAARDGKSGAPQHKRHDCAEPACMLNDPP